MTNYYNNTQAGRRGAKVARRKRKKFDFLTLISRTLQFVASVFMVVYAIGGLAIVSVCYGLYVQEWWRPFATFSIFVTKCLGVFLGIVVFAGIVYCFSFAMAKKCRRIAKKMYPAHRVPWIIRERRFKLACNIISSVKKKFIAGVKFVVKVGEYAPF